MNARRFQDFVEEAVALTPTAHFNAIVLLDTNLHPTNNPVKTSTSVQELVGFVQMEFAKI